VSLKQGVIDIVRRIDPPDIAAGLMEIETHKKQGTKYMREKRGTGNEKGAGGGAKMGKAG